MEGREKRTHVHTHVTCYEKSASFSSRYKKYTQEQSELFFLPNCSLQSFYLKFSFLNKIVPKVRDAEWVSEVKGEEGKGFFFVPLYVFCNCFTARFPFVSGWDRYASWLAGFSSSCPLCIFKKQGKKIFSCTRPAYSAKKWCCGCGDGSGMHGGSLMCRACKGKHAI